VSDVAVSIHVFVKFMTLLMSDEYG
jgi:hypothetical protein